MSVFGGTDSNNRIRSGEPTRRLEPLIPIWADDIAIAVEDVSAGRLIEKDTAISKMLLDRLLAARLTPNMSPGKSESLKLHFLLPTSSSSSPSAVLGSCSGSWPACTPARCHARAVMALAKFSEAPASVMAPDVFMS